MGTIWGQLRMATITQRSNKMWQAKIRRQGHKEISKVFRTKAEAQKWSRHIESEMDRGIFVSTVEAETTSLNDLFDRYVQDILPTRKSQRQVLSCVNSMRGRLGEYRISALTPSMLSEYRDMRLANRRPSTVRNELMLLSKLFQLCLTEWEIYLPFGNPIKRIKVPSQGKGRDRRLQDGELDELLKGAIDYGGEIYAIIILAIETGMRRTELTKLNWQYIDLQTGVAKIFDTKNGDDREIPLSLKAKETLELMPRNATGFVFNIKPDSITQAFERICKKRDIVGLRFHDLRHEATSRFFELGFNIMEVSAITGHKDLQMLKRYTHLKAEDLAKRLR